ncbi:hypothetical protein MEO93_25500 [Dolichospermum sp. ST_sed3]|nr:hypothetical protein [Dolichospermum sp. ST_sed3]
MKKSIQLVLLLLTLSIQMYSQPIKPLWSRKVPEGINWQMVTSLGNYIAGTTQGIAGINPETGEMLWKNDKVGQLTQDKVKQLGSSALLTITNNNNITVLDPFSGIVKFDANNAGISEIRDQKVLYKANGILVSGRNAAGKDIMLMSALEDGKVKWKIEDAFGRFITASEVGPGELLIVTLYYNYKVNPAMMELMVGSVLENVNTT